MNATTNESGKKQDIARKMEDISKKAAEPGIQGARQAQETLSSFNNTMMKAFDQNRAAVQQLMRAMQEESFRFFSTRVEHTSRALERTRDYQGLSGFITLQQDWLLDVARDYAEFNKRFGELLQEVAEQGIDSGHSVMSDASRTQKSALNERYAA